jgi:hypothetical protein
LSATDGGVELSAGWLEWSGLGGRVGEFFHLVALDASDG